jgi:hypothetical protein
MIAIINYINLHNRTIKPQITASFFTKTMAAIKKLSITTNNIAIYLDY